MGHDTYAVVLPQGSKEVSEGIDHTRTPLPVLHLKRRASHVLYDSEEFGDSL